MLLFIIVLKTVNPPFHCIKMTQDEENKLPMITQHTVTMLQDSIVVFGGTPVTVMNGIACYSNCDQDQDKRTIWTYNLHTDLWRKYVLPGEDEMPPFHQDKLQ